LAASVLEAQAAAMGLPINFQAASWDGYERKFLDALTTLKSQGIEYGVFGDIDLDPHREWVERVCAEGGIIAHEPLWMEPRRKLVDEFLEAGFQARIVSLKEALLPREMLGAQFSPELVERIEAAGCDACGENGEFHTVVTGGPLFSRTLKLEPGEIVSVAGYACLDFSVA
jgi:uncharacterized protein (TIGR00290 family)